MLAFFCISHRHVFPINLNSLAHTVNSLALQGLKDTTKARDGLQRMPLMSGIGGAVFVNDVTADEVATAAADLGC